MKYMCDGFTDCLQLEEDGVHVIDVHINKEYDAALSSVDKDPGEYSFASLIGKKYKPLRRNPCTAIFVNK